MTDKEILVDPLANLDSDEIQTPDPKKDKANSDVNDKEKEDNKKEKEVKPEKEEPQKEKVISPEKEKRKQEIEA